MANQRLDAEKRGLEADQSCDAALSLLKESFGLLTCSRESHVGFARVVIPIITGNEYGFDLYFYDTGTIEIAAVLESDRRAPEHTAPYFWHWPFELPDYASYADMFSRFRHILCILLTTPSRIIQRRRFICWTFECQTQKHDRFDPLYRHAVLRWRVDIPVIHEKEAIYHARNVFSGREMGKAR